MNDTVFIYKKEKEVWVLDFEESKLKHDGFVENGFKHIGTLKSSVWLQFILNMDDSADIINEINELLNPQK